MKRFALVLPFLLLIVSANESLAAEDSLITQDIAIIKRDYRNFYLDKDNLAKLGVGIAGAGIFANTSMDGDIQEFYQDNIRGETTDSMSKILKLPGNVFVTIPLLFSARIFLKEMPAGKWAQKSLRAIIVGAPAGLFIQRAIGASRPSEDDSKWRPLKDADGLSGHVFIGAVPFITAAKMNDNPYIKGILYGLSVLPGLSRINDNKHYFSQAALGWYLAFLSCSAIEKTESKNRTKFLITPLSGNGVAVFVGHVF
ncbi:MAG: phosphatase PAP2 family protein [Nitrospirota bacterium]